MKILMIGGTGTISYDATKYFLAQNHDVYLLNRGNRNNLSDERLNYIIGNANDAKSLESALDGKEFDVILDFILYNVNQMKERLAIYNKNVNNSYLYHQQQHINQQMRLLQKKRIRK